MTNKLGFSEVSSFRPHTRVIRCMFLHVRLDPRPPTRLPRQPTGLSMLLPRAVTVSRAGNMQLQCIDLEAPPHTPRSGPDKT